MADSDALNAAINSIANYMDDHVEVETHTNGKRNVLGQLIDGMQQSARKLTVTEDLLWLSTRISHYDFTEFLAQLTQKPAIQEYLASELGYEALRKAQTASDRLPTLLRVISECSPPERSTKYLESAATCFLYGFDRESIAMCRGAVEVLVEEQFPDVAGSNLGPAIAKLRESGRLDESIAKDMLSINAQAREILHDEPGRRPPNAEECLFLLGRVLRRQFRQ
jgi:hypothetical protein